MTKKILVIGNGFDIEHGFPTQYTDFLDFVSPEYKTSKAYGLFEIKDIINEKRNTIIEILGSDNTIIKLFKERLQENISIGKNWVDFEQEIARVIKFAERKFYGEEVKPEEEEDFVILPFDFTSDTNDSERFHEDFYRLLCAFEVYIAYIVNILEYKWFSKDIQDIRPDYIISLNYSNTFERVYSKFQPIDYIHGKASLEDVISGKDNLDVRLEDYRAANHIILGMDEYLTDDEIKQKTEYIAFRKYFQRITKKTGAEYKKWIAEGDLEVYIFGHSLDPTDAELLTELIDKKQSKTTIFYHNESAYISEVTNLIRIFGKIFVIDNCHGDNPKITFRKQREREEIKTNDSFLFKRTLDTISHFTYISSSEFEENHNKLSAFLNSGRGIDTQLDAITAFDVLRNINFQNLYKKQIIELIKKLPAINDEGQLVNAIQYELDDWMEPTVGNGAVVPFEIAELLNLANQVNDERLKKEGMVLIGSDDYYIHPFEKHIPDSIDQKEYREFLVKMIGMLRSARETKRIWNLLKKVSISEGNIEAKKELSALKNKRDDAYTLALCNYLENYIDFETEELKYNKWFATNNDTDV